MIETQVSHPKPHCWSEVHFGLLPYIFCFFVFDTVLRSSSWPVTWHAVEDDLKWIPLLRIFSSRVHHVGPGWSWTHGLTEDSLELLIFFASTSQVMGSQVGTLTHYLINQGFTALSRDSNVVEALTYIQFLNNELTQLKGHWTLFWKEYG